MEKCHKHKLILEDIIQKGISFLAENWIPVLILAQAFLCNLFSSVVKRLAGAREARFYSHSYIPVSWTLFLNGLFRWQAGWCSVPLSRAKSNSGLGYSSPFLWASRPGHENNVGLNPPEFPSARHREEWEEFKVIRERKIVFCGLAEGLKILWSRHEVVLHLGGNAVFHTFF